MPQGSGEEKNDGKETLDSAPEGDFGTSLMDDEAGGNKSMEVITCMEQARIGAILVTARYVCEPAQHTV